MACCGTLFVYWFQFGSLAVYWENEIFYGKITYFGDWFC